MNKQTLEERIEHLESNDDYNTTKIKQITSNPIHAKEVVECYNCGVLVNKMKTKVEVLVKEYPHQETDEILYRDEIKIYYCRHCQE